MIGSMDLGNLEYWVIHKMASCCSIECVISVLWIEAAQRQGASEMLSIIADPNVPRVCYCYFPQPT
jgi:hypothetical protein